MSGPEIFRCICRSTLPITALVLSKLFLCALPIADIVIGTIYLEDCPRQHYIPIYLIVSGVFGLVLALLSCLPCDEENPLSPFCAAWNSLTSFFLSCWFIAGNVWIYSIYEPNYNQTRTDLGPYCDKTLYLFAFWSTTAGYILMGISIVFCLCGFCCSIFGVAYVFSSGKQFNNRAECIIWMNTETAQRCVICA